jgi:hypothetical protein
MEVVEHHTQATIEGGAHRPLLLGGFVSPSLPADNLVAQLGEKPARPGFFALDRHLFCSGRRHLGKSRDAGQARVGRDTGKTVLERRGPVLRASIS